VSESQQTTGAAESLHAGGLGATLLRAAWLAILLGFVMEALLLIFAAGFRIFPGLESMIEDLAGKVTWSTLFCAGLALGTAASRARAPLMGVLGLFAAPIALHASRALQQGVAKTLEEVAAGASIANQTLIFLASSRQSSTLASVCLSAGSNSVVGAG
jgi:hypothetical protein